jgi:hypothetical protein
MILAVLMNELWMPAWRHANELLLPAFPCSSSAA